jgi:hypothetical protein
MSAGLKYDRQVGENKKALQDKKLMEFMERQKEFFTCRIPTYRTGT